MVKKPISLKQLAWWLHAKVPGLAAARFAAKDLVANPVWPSRNTGALGVSRSTGASLSISAPIEGTALQCNDQARHNNQCLESDVGCGGRQLGRTVRGAGSGAQHRRRWRSGVFLSDQEPNEDGVRPPVSVSVSSA